MQVINNIVVLDEDDIEFMEAATGETPDDFSVSGMREYLNEAIDRRSETSGMQAMVVTNMLKGYRDSLGATGTIQ